MGVEGTQDAAALLRTVLGNVPDFVMHLAPDGTILFINHLAPGYTMEKVIGRHVLEFNPPGTHARVRQMLHHVVHTATPDAYESIGEGPHGQDANYLNRAAPVMDGGRVVSIILVATDITELRARDAALRRSEQTLKLALRAARLGLWEWDVATGLHHAFDERAREVLGLGPTANPGFPEYTRDHVHPEDRARVSLAMEDALVTGQYGALDHRVVLPGNTVRWVRVFGTLERDDAGAAVRVVGTVRDVTDQRGLEEQLVHAQKMESVGRLAGGMAHDFNNMLTAILSGMDLAMDHLPPEHPARAELSIAQKAAERSAGLTAQLLTFARRQVLQLRVTTMTALLDITRPLLTHVLGDHVRLVVEGTARGSVRLDPMRMEQVLVNLAVNARDAMPNGGTLTLSLSDVELDAAACARLPGLSPGPHVELRVVDTGVGVGAAQLPHIFEPYFTTKAHGNGLGLATSFGIIKQHDGHITVESTPGVGTTFCILLPHTRAVAEAPIPKPPPVVTPVRGRTVLLVEDDPTVRNVTGRALRRLGFTILLADGPSAALETLRTHPQPIHALVTDMEMPGGSGLELARAARATTPGLVVLVVSGLVADEHALAALRDERMAFLPKPYLPGTLAQRLEQLLATG